jgi:endonuclease/exonuclease/phosphatase family metal-dependent hydrolase
LAVFHAHRAFLAFALIASGCAAAPLAPRAPTQGAEHYTIQSYNVECGKHEDESIIEAIGFANADIVCLQETTPEYETVIRRRYGERYPNQLYEHNAPDTGAAGLAVLSRFPIVDRGHHLAPFGWYPAWHLEVETPSGPVQILHVHLRAKLSGRNNDFVALVTLRGDHRREIEHFMRWSVHDQPTLVVGDFNEEADGGAVSWLGKRGFRDALSLFRPDDHTWRQPFLAWELRQTLDHILFDKAFVPLDARVIDKGSSDHLPVVAHFQISKDPRWASHRRPVVDARIAP